MGETGGEDAVAEELEAAEEGEVGADLVFAEEHAEAGGVDEFGLDGEDVGEGEHGRDGDGGRKCREVVVFIVSLEEAAAGDAEDKMSEEVVVVCGFEGGECPVHSGGGGVDQCAELFFRFPKGGEFFKLLLLVMVNYTRV